MKKRSIVILLILAMMLSICACGQSAPATEPTQQVSNEPTNPPAEPITVAAGGATEFRIIFAEGASNDIQNTVAYLQEQLAALTGAEFKAMEDMAVSSKAESFEILVGATDRAASKDALSGMTGSGDYLVKVDGNKIVLAGMLDMGVQEAAEKLIADLSAQSDFALPGDYAYNGVSDSPVQYLPAFTYGSLSTSYDCGDGADMLIYNSDETGFVSYQSDLEAAGFTKYTENTIAQNKFATFTKDNVMVHMMSLPAMGNVRIVAQEDAILPATAADSVTGVVQPSVTQLGLEGYDTNGSANQIGMSFLYQLSDGSFIIVDGGHNNTVATTQLYNKMQELAPDPSNIKVVAWFLTHAHWDHLSCLLKFSEDYAGQLTVEKFICNMPNDQEMNGGSESESTYRTRVYEAAEKLGAQIIKAYTGQVYYLGDAVVEILLSVEVMAPQSFEDFNNSSMIFSVTLGGTKLMQLADCGPLQSPVLVSLYGNTLKSDIVQNAHHGYRGATSELYRNIDPDYMFWPSGTNAFNNYKDMDYNVWVLSRVKENWLALDQIITINLPVQ